jgi:hypothetical protein
MDQYADCYIDPEKLPEDEIRSALAVVTGSLGLSFPRTADAMRRAVKVAKGAGATVRGCHSSLARVPSRVAGRPVSSECGAVSLARNVVCGAGRSEHRHRL